MNTRSEERNVYRTRFLIRAQQLNEPMVFIDFLGREHRGAPGDYLVESSQGSLYIAAQKIFEDIYVLMEPQGPQHNPSFNGTGYSDFSAELGNLPVNNQHPAPESFVSASGTESGIRPFVEKSGVATASHRLIASDTIYRDTLLTGTTGRSTVAIP